MPGYSWLFEAGLTGDEVAAKMRGLRRVGVPYSDAQIAAAKTEVMGKTEADALIAYLQVLGTSVKTR